jgi:hypothetical protein
MALIKVEFEWDDRFGECYDCGRPAGFTIHDKATGTFEDCEVEMRRLTNGERGCETPEAHTADPTDLRCAVCAANAAVDGTLIYRLFTA